jgi:hypothetical protein
MVNGPTEARVILKIAQKPLPHLGIARIQNADLNFLSSRSTMRPLCPYCME